MRHIDLRSDTVTKPTPEMRAVMAEAPVGDDVFGDDPTVNRLEEAAATMLGKEAAMYVPTGTMSNQIAIRAHTEPGDVVVIEAELQLGEFFQEQLQKSYPKHHVFRYDAVKENYSHEEERYLWIFDPFDL